MKERKSLGMPKPWESEKNGFNLFFKIAIVFAINWNIQVICYEKVIYSEADLGLLQHQRWSSL